MSRWTCKVKEKAGEKCESIENHNVGMNLSAKPSTKRWLDGRAKEQLPWTGADKKSNEGGIRLGGVKHGKSCYRAGTTSIQMQTEGTTAHESKENCLKPARMESESKGWWTGKRV